jgi:hypothetical protein
MLLNTWYILLLSKGNFILIEIPQIWQYLYRDRVSLPIRRDHYQNGMYRDIDHCLYNIIVIRVTVDNNVPSWVIIDMNMYLYMLAVLFNLLLSINTHLWPSDPWPAALRPFFTSSSHYRIMASSKQVLTSK